MSTNASSAHTHHGQYAYTPKKKAHEPGNKEYSYNLGKNKIDPVATQPKSQPKMSTGEPSQPQPTTNPKDNRSCIRKPVNIFSLVTGFLGAGAVAAAEILPHTALSVNPAVTAALKPMLYGGAGSLAVSIGAQLLKCLSRTNCSGPDPGCCVTCSMPDCACDVPNCC